MEIVLTVANILALVAVPIIAVCVGQKLQDRAEKRKDKMAIFQCLMTHRATGWAMQDTVNALNSIDIIFSEDNEVRACWASLLSKYKPNYSMQEVSTAQCKLLEAMAKALGYENIITWETIQNPYYPEGLVQRTERNARFEEGKLAMADFMVKMMSNPTQFTNVTAPKVEQEENYADAELDREG